MHNAHMNIYLMRCVSYEAHVDTTEIKKQHNSHNMSKNPICKDVEGNLKDKLQFTTTTNIANNPLLQRKTVSAHNCNKQ